MIFGSAKNHVHKQLRYPNKGVKVAGCAMTDPEMVYYVARCNHKPS